MAARVGTKAKVLEPTATFVQRTSDIKRVFAVLFSLQNQLAKLPAASVVSIGDGLTFSRRDITRLRSDGNKLLDTNNSEYKHAHFFAKKTYERKPRAAGVGGFQKPVGITDNTKEFFANVAEVKEAPSAAIVQGLNYKFWETDDPVTSGHLIRLFNNYFSVEMLGSIEDGRIIEIDEEDVFAQSFKDELDKLNEMSATLRQELERVLKAANSSDLTGRSLAYTSVKGVPSSKPLKNNSNQIFTWLVAAKPNSLNSDARALGYDSAAEAIKSSTKKDKLKARVVPKLEANLNTYFNSGDYRDFARSKYFAQYTPGRGDVPSVYTIAIINLSSIISLLTTPYDGVFDPDRAADLQSDIDELHKYSAARKAFEQANKSRLNKEDLREQKVIAGLSAIGLRPESE